MISFDVLIRFACSGRGTKRVQLKRGRRAVEDYSPRQVIAFFRKLNEKSTEIKHKNDNKMLGKPEILRLRGLDLCR